MMKSLIPKKELAVTLAACVTFSSAVFAQDKETQEVLQGEALPAEIANPYDENEVDMDALAEKINNPISELWFLAIQNDTTVYTGDFDGGDSRVFNNFKLQPVMSLPVTENYNLVVRPVFQYLSYDYPELILDDPNPPINENSFDLDFDRQDGFGDTILLTSFGPSEPEGKLIIAGGPTFMLPTASDDEFRILQNNDWAAGPSLTGIYIGDQWILGAFAQHWWGIGNRDQDVRINIPANNTQLKVEIDGDDLNLTDIQYIVRYRLNAQTNIGAAPNIGINWNESGSDMYTIPVGIGFDTMLKLGPLPAKWGVELQYYVNQPDAFGPEWNFRMFLVPIVPNPFRR